MAIVPLGAGPAPTPVTSGNLAAVGYPGSLTALDVLVMPVWARDNVAVTLPRDWTIKSAINNGAASRLSLAWKRMAPGDADTSVAVTHSGGDVTYGRVFGYRGVIDSGDPFEAFTSRANASIGGSGSWGSLDLTTLTNGAYWIHVILSADDSASASGAGFAANSPAGLASIVELEDFETTTGLDMSGAVYEALKATAGRQTGLTITFGPTAAAVSTEWVGALKPAPTVVALGQAVETSSAMAMTIRKVVAIGRAATVETATALRIVRRVTLGIVSTRETALPLTIITSAPPPTVRPPTTLTIDSRTSSTAIDSRSTFLTIDAGPSTSLSIDPRSTEVNLDA